MHVIAVESVDRSFPNFPFADTATLLMFITASVTTPVSERNFSTMKRIKTVTQNSLRLLPTNVEGEENEFNSTKDIFHFHILPF